MSTLMNGARILLECLVRENVEVIFGYPGGVTLPLYDAMYDHQIRHVLVRHEENAAFAASGYSHATGKVGVCCATSGPGATNLTTGLVDAMMDSVPVVALTGQVTSKLIGSDAFQEADTVGITRSATKHNFLVKDVKELAQVIHEAFYIASTAPGSGAGGYHEGRAARNGALRAGERDPSAGLQGGDGRPRRADPPGGADDLGSGPAVCVCRRRVLHAEAHKELQELVELVELADLPAVCTLMGLGGLPGSHPNFISMPGMHGSYAANMGMYECDLLIALGVRFDDRVTGRLASFAPHAKVIHVDIDPAEIGKNRTPDLPSWAT